MSTRNPPLPFGHLPQWGRKSTCYGRFGGVEKVKGWMLITLIRCGLNSYLLSCYISSKLYIRDITKFL
jgi:hypothetical protein